MSQRLIRNAIPPPPASGESAAAELATQMATSSHSSSPARLDSWEDQTWEGQTRGGQASAVDKRSVDKRALAEQFSGAALRYDDWATAQAEIATGLIKHLPDELAPSRIVELGCGTGLLSAQLLRRYPSATLLGIDLAPGMVEHCRRHFETDTETPAGGDTDTVSRARFVVGDVEDPAIVVPCADLIASSCVAQWFTDLAATLRLWSASLAPGGLMAFACLLEGSFPELESSYREGLQCGFRGLRLPSAETVPLLMRSSGLAPLVCRQTTVTALYESSHLALRSFRQIGAVLAAQPGHQALGAAATRRLLACYDRHCTADGRAPVTHRVQYVVAQRTSQSKPGPASEAGPASPDASS